MLDKPQSTAYKPRPDMTNWSTADAVNLRSFLKKSPQFIEALKASAPRCAGAAMEERAMTGAERQGWQNAADHIKDVMASDRPASSPIDNETTPDLES